MIALLWCIRKTASGEGYRELLQSCDTFVGACCGIVVKGEGDCREFGCTATQSMG
jgi:hypothetical protein